MRRHLEWLEQELQATRNRLDAARFSPWTPQAVLDSLERTIAQLTEEIKAVQQAVSRQLEQDSPWSRPVELLTSIPGVGTQRAALLLSEMPPVRRCTRAGQWVAFCGLAPEPRQSGKGHYSRLSRVGPPGSGGPLPARHQRPALESCGTGLGPAIARPGQDRTGRIVAAMHKLLRLCFGVLKSGQPFDPNRCKPRAALDL